jgi:hypothetical protein
MVSSNGIIIRDINGRSVRRSKNLRGILEYCRTCQVERVDLFGPNRDGEGVLGVTWADGSTCVTDFASYRLMAEWAKARRAFDGRVYVAS